MLVEDASKSRSPVRDSSPHFPVFKEFKGTSYLQRYDLLCQKLTREQLYTVASLIAAELYIRLLNPFKVKRVVDRSKGKEPLCCRILSSRQYIRGCRRRHVPGIIGLVQLPPAAAGAKFSFVGFVAILSRCRGGTAAVA